MIVTQDKDFLVLASQGILHAGIVYYKARTRTVKQILKGLFLLHHKHSAEQMHNHIEFI